MTLDTSPEADENLWRFWANKAQALAEENKALSAALTASQAETAAAYDAGRSGTHLRLSIARKIGMYGCAYDGPYDARAYTYEHLPGNQDAYGIGKAASNASKDRAGDHIDVGISLMRHMNDAGFGVFALNKHDTLHALTPAKAETATAFEAAAMVKPLDMSNMLKHAFMCGWDAAETTSSSREFNWTEYDPTESAAHARIMAALAAIPKGTS